MLFSNEQDLTDVINSTRKAQMNTSQLQKFATTDTCMVSEMIRDHLILLESETVSSLNAFKLIQI